MGYTMRVSHWRYTAWFPFDPKGAVADLAHPVARELYAHDPAKVRDPLTVALSRDGRNFSACRIVQTCTDLAGGDSTCKARQKKNHNVGPSYPQGLSVIAPAPEALRGRSIDRPYRPISY